MTGAVVIRAERADEHGAVAEVVGAAFGSLAEARLVEAIRESDHYIPELSLVAVVDGQVVGHVMVSHVALDDGTTQRRVASLAPLAVAPEFQGRGIGSALVRAVAARADAAGEPLMVLEGSPVFYGRLGFEPSARYGIDMELPPWAPAEAAQVLLLSGFDAATRGRVVYPPAFDSVSGG
jgi:putative acetyltransferase